MRTRLFRTKFKPKAWLILSILFCASGSAVAEESEIGESRQKELKNLVIQDCGSCHGLTLEGGLGPALLPENIADKPADWLKQAILDGIPGTAMPPWRPFINEAEADWLVKMLQQGAINE